MFELSVIVGFGFEACTVLEHVDNHFFIHAVHRRGADDASYAFQSPQKRPRGSSRAQLPQAVGQSFGQVLAAILALPQLK